MVMGSGRDLRRCRAGEEFASFQFGKARTEVTKTVDLA
jgi:hypothetical protein